MLRTRLNDLREKRARGDKGFTLIELLVVVIIIGILAAVAIPVFLGQRQKAFDAGVQSDLKNLATAAESNFADALTYPDTVGTFNNKGATAGTPIVTKSNTFQAYTIPSGANAGYVIFGKATGSDKVWAVSSYNGGAPAVVAAATALPLATVLPSTLAGNAFGIPTGATGLAAVATVIGTP